MVDWGLARQIARLAARSDELPDLGVDIAAMTRGLEDRVIAYVGLEPGEPPPRAEAVSRVEWADANLDSLATLIDPVARRLDERLGTAGPFAGALRLGAGATLAAEVGLVIGYVSQRVLGQYELSLLAAEAAPRLLFVAPNLDAAARELEADRDGFIRWVAIHELVHAVQFAGVPWLRGHLGDLLRLLLRTVDVRVERGAGRLPSMADLAQLAGRLREGGLAALVQTPEQRRLLERMQAAMAIVEGHAEHAMDALAPELVPHHEGMRAAMNARRRDRSAPERVLARLLGFDLKLRQYELGKGFCDAIVARGGIELLNRVWEAPEALPSLAELERPDDWLARAAPAPTRG